MTGTPSPAKIAAALLALVAAACGGRVGDKAPGGRDSGGSGADDSGASNAGASNAGTTTGSGGAGAMLDGGKPNGAGGGTSGGDGGAGGTRGMPSSGADPGAPATGASGSPGSTTTLSTPMRQVWVGEVTRWVTYPDAPNAETTPEHVVLVLNADGSDAPGSIVLGNAAPPPPATDPSAFYPPTKDSGQDLANRLGSTPLEGAPYALLGVWRTDTLLSFQIDPKELWSAWCAQQASCPPSAQCTPTELGGTFCLANVSNPSPHPASRDDLCGSNPTGISVCVCDQTNCHWNATDSSTQAWTFDLQLKNSLLDGQLSYGKFSPSGAWILGVRLRRVQ